MHNSGKSQKSGVWIRQEASPGNKWRENGGKGENAGRGGRGGGLVSDINISAGLRENNPTT